MSFDVRVANSVSQVGQEAWDRLSEGRPFTSFRWYRFGEAVLADNTPVYIILSRQGEPLARATFWLRRREALPVSSRIVRRLVEMILGRWPVLLCQTPLADASGLILPDPPPLRDAALKIIAQAAQDQARKHNASFLGVVYLKRHQADWAGWPEDFATITVPNPGTHLIITWPDFEGYVASLSKSMRKDYRRHRNRAASQDIAVEYHPMTKPLNETILDQAMTLIRNVETHHGSAPDPWARAILRNACMADATWLTAHMKGRLVGCGLVVGDGDSQAMKLLGLDYKIRYAYFQLIYTAIRCAIEGGFRVLWGGSGAYDMKQRLGFQVEEENHVVFAGRGALFERLGRWAAAKL